MVGGDLSLGHDVWRESSLMLNCSPCKSRFPAVVSGDDVVWWRSGGAAAGRVLLGTRHMSKRSSGPFELKLFGFQSCLKTYG